MSREPSHPQHAQWSRYARRLSCFAVLVLLAIASFNLFVDPFAAYRLPGSLGLDPYREEYESRIARAEIPRHERCEGVILGTSRAQLALDPESPVWGRPTCNLAITGASIVEVAATLRYALHFPEVREAFWSIDFLSFDDRAGLHPEFLRSRFDPNLDLLDYNAGLLVGGAALRASWHVVKDWWADRRASFSPLGGPRPSIPKWEHDYRARFEGALERDLRGLMLSATPRDYAPSTLRPLFDAILEAREHGVEVTLVTLPSHALHFETLARSNHWQQFEQWKRDLVAERDRLDLGEVPIWDCTRYDGPTTEAIPPAPRGSDRMRWHWDAVHTTRRYGEAIVEYILGARRRSIGEPDSLGRCALLEADSISRTLERVRTAQVEYRREHPEQLVIIDEVLARMQSR